MQYGIRLDDPLSQGLDIAIDLTQSMRELVRHTNPVTANGVMATGIGGRGYNHTGAGTIANWGNLQGGASLVGDFTMMLVASLTAQSGSYRGLVSAAEGVGSTGGWWFGATDANALVFAHNFNNASVTWAGAAPTDAGLYHFILRRIGPVVSLWVNGIRLDDRSSGFFSTSQNNSSFRLGLFRADASSEARTGVYHLFQKWTRGVGNRDVADLIQDPWRLLRKKRIVVYGVPDNNEPVDVFVAGGDHSHDVDQATVVQNHSLTVVGTYSDHDAQEATVSLFVILAPDDCFHMAFGDDSSIQQTHVIETTNTVHSHQAEITSATVGGVLAPQSIDHDHTVESIVIVQLHRIDPMESLHMLVGDLAVLLREGVTVPNHRRIKIGNPRRNQSINTETRVIKAEMN